MFRAVKRAFLRAIPSKAAGRLRAWRVQRLIDTYDAHVVEHCYGGHRLAVRLADPLAEGWYDRDWPELPEIALLRGAAIRAGATVFDLGAHQGVVALMLAREVGPGGQVIAVEPNRHNFDVACSNRVANDASQLELLHAAVADRNGTLTFNRGLNGQIDDGTGAGGQAQVNAVTIDTLALRYGAPDLVFLDVEGAECMALGGAARVLESSATFVVEVHVGCGLELLGGSVKELLSRFPIDRYTLVIRAENDAEFRSLRADEPLLTQRCFLVARPHARPQAESL